MYLNCTITIRSTCFPEAAIVRLKIGWLFPRIFQSMQTYFFPQSCMGQIYNKRTQRCILSLDDWATWMLSSPYLEFGRSSLFYRSLCGQLYLKRTQKKIVNDLKSRDIYNQLLSTPYRLFFLTFNTISTLLHFYN